MSYMSYYHRVNRAVTLASYLIADVDGWAHGSVTVLRAAQLLRAVAERACDSDDYREMRALTATANAARAAYNRNTAYPVAPHRGFGRL